MEKEEIQSVVAGYNGEAETIVMAANRKITDAPGYNSAVQLRLDIRDRAKKIEAKRMEVTKPMRAAVDAVNAMFKEPLTVLERAEKAINGVIKTWSDEQERIRAEEERKVNERAEAERTKAILQSQAALKKGNVDKAGDLMDKALAIPDDIKVAPTFEKSSQFKTRKIWKFEVVDPAQVPREYMSVDTVKIGNATRPADGVRDIPGVRIYQEEIPC